MKKSVPVEEVGDESDSEEVVGKRSSIRLI